MYVCIYVVYVYGSRPNASLSCVCGLLGRGERRRSDRRVVLRTGVRVLVGRRRGSLPSCDGGEPNSPPGSGESSLVDHRTNQKEDYPPRSVKARFVYSCDRVFKYRL